MQRLNSCRSFLAIRTSRIPYKRKLSPIGNKIRARCSHGRPFGHNRHGPKSGGCYAPFKGEAGSASNTMWPGPRAEAYLRTKWHLDPSNRLVTIHQCYRDTAVRQDRQTKHTEYLCSQRQSVASLWIKHSKLLSRSLAFINVEFTQVTLTSFPQLQLPRVLLLHANSCYTAF